MLLPKKAAALAAGFARRPLRRHARPERSAPQAGRAGAETLVLDELASLDWIEKSDVAALREGVIETDRAQDRRCRSSKGKRDRLPPQRDRRADGREGQPGRKQRGRRGEGRGPEASWPWRSSPATSGSTSADPGMVSQEEMREGRGRGEGRRRDGQRGRSSSSKLDQGRAATWPSRPLKEHTILAPFDGIVIERLKNPGESVRANEAVVQLGNLDKLRAWAYVPLEYAYRVKEGQIVESSPGSSGTRGGHAADRAEAVPGQDHLRRSRRSSRSPRPPSGSTPSSRTRTRELQPGPQGR